MAKFTVDTHLFRELGELLVGRDSTALVELIKNSYDADAVHVTVHGENLDKPNSGRIIITDNGSGMTAEQFQNGFLRIASRLKDSGTRRSEFYGRRFTGAKGVGRLAAHKLACLLILESTPRELERHPVSARINWDGIEALETLDEIEESDAVTVEERFRAKGEKHSTTIELKKLRRKWTPSERTKLFWEVTSFRPPDMLVNLPPKLLAERTIIDKVQVNDVQKLKGDRLDPGFTVELTGDFAAGEDYWKTLALAANWVIEIKAEKGSKVKFNIIPTIRCQEELNENGLEMPSRQVFSMDHPAPDDGPFFHARILVREGQAKTPGEQKAWFGQQSGVRVYMEGFRVLPYGEQSDDWLEIDSDYARRDRSLRFLDGFGEGDGDDQEGLIQLRKTSYFGGVFLIQEKAASLRMLVNREGFVPDAAYDVMKQLVRTGIDLSVRRRAAVRHPLREKRSEVRASAAQERALPPKKKELKEAVEKSVERATQLAKEARISAARGDVERASKLIEGAAREFKEGSEINERLLTERSMLRILSGVGLQMAAFVHEINGLLGMTRSIEETFDRLEKEHDFSKRNNLGIIRKSIGDLRRVVERQASYLTDITSPDARRKRSRMRLVEKFDAATRLIRPALERRNVELEISIAEDLKSPPMFPAELMVIFSNLLTNAVKAAGVNGRILVTAKSDGSENVLFRMENTGRQVDLDQSERWFRPFETTTTQTDPVLGQGMGMGLPITRNILEEYGAEIRFVKPSRHFSTSIEIRFTGGFQ